LYTTAARHKNAKRNVNAKVKSVPSKNETEEGEQKKKVQNFSRKQVHALTGRPVVAE
jgi:hypothetical protein